MNKETELRLCNPGAEYRGKPFWSWNGALEEEELLRQIDVGNGIWRIFHAFSNGSNSGIFRAKMVFIDSKMFGIRI